MAIGVVGMDGGGILSRAASGPLKSVQDFIEERIRERQNRPRQTGATSGAGLGIQERSIRFQPRSDLGLIQTRVIEPREGKIIREVPTSRRVRFIEAFTKQIASDIGRRFDLEA